MNVFNSIASTSRALLRTTPRLSRALATSVEQSPSPVAPESSDPEASASTSATAAPEATTSSSAPSILSALPAAFRAPSTPAPVRTSAPPPPSSFRQMGRRVQNPYKLHVYSTRNNTILTLTYTPGFKSDQELRPSDPHHPVAWVSAGSAGYKGASRGTYDAAVEVSLRMFKKIEDLVDPPVGSGGQRKKVKSPPPTSLEVIWKGFGQGRDAVYRSLLGGEGDGVRPLVNRVTDATPLKIGGTRAKKRRVI
ncbi:translational machinery component [Meredithblackwellia eburnea MCA 4105]